MNPVVIQCPPSYLNTKDSTRVYYVEVLTEVNYIVKLSESCYSDDVLDYDRNIRVML